MSFIIDYDFCIIAMGGAQRHRLCAVGELEFRQLTGQPNKGTNFYFTYKVNWLSVKPKAKD